jgi:carboxymethylenebutenolidase
MIHAMPSISPARVSLATLASLILFLGGSTAQTSDPHADRAASSLTQAPAAAAMNEALPPDAAHAKEALEKSPRHGEWVDVAVAGGTVPLRTWVVYPERKDKAGVVIVIHEIFGLSDWIRGVADQLAEDGFIAVAPDLISGKGPGNGGTDSVSSSDDVEKLVRGLSPEEVVTRLDAVRDWALKVPAANRRTATIGFCWGGARSFAYATTQLALDAAVVYYGTSPDAAKLAAVKAPVLGLYGGDDERVNATIEPAAAEMKKGGKMYEPHVYEGAGHGFLRQQDGRDGANMKATEQAWPATIAFLRRHLQ